MYAPAASATTLSACMREQPHVQIDVVRARQRQMVAEQQARNSDEMDLERDHEQQQRREHADVLLRPRRDDHPIAARRTRRCRAR